MDKLTASNGILVLLFHSDYLKKKGCECRAGLGMWCFLPDFLFKTFCKLICGWIVFSILLWSQRDWSPCRLFSLFGTLFLMEPVHLLVWDKCLELVLLYVLASN